MSYPVVLDLRRMPSLIVGGGAVACRKVEGVVGAGGRPTVIAPEISPAFDVLIRRHELECHARAFEVGDTAGYAVVFAATDRREVNASVAREAADSGALVNVADDPALSNFHVPAVVRQGDVTVAVATGGASPLLSRRLRERLEQIVTPGVGRAAARLRDLRVSVQQRWPNDEARRRALWIDLITPGFLTCAIEGRDEEVELRIARCLSRS